MSEYGSQGMVAPLRRVLVKRPEAAFGSADPERWHYTAQPLLASAQAEHDAFVAVLRAAGADVVYHDEPLPEHADAIFTFDPAIVTDAGAVLLNMGKELRRGEEAAMSRVFARLGIPVIYELHDEARAEGGDLLWLDHDTLYAGLGFRTNREGVRQLGEALAPLGVTVHGVDLPYFTGPAACLHLLGLISMVDDDLAVVYEPQLPVALWQDLRARGVELVRVPEAEFLQTMGTNVLALAPRRCLMLAGNPETRGMLEEAGCTVQTYRGDELSLKAEGGPTCLTRPLLRG
ncbi:MAG: dimethylarginine dimethylaminohydrolase family protein [Thermoleophilia bacterium]